MCSYSFRSLFIGQRENSVACAPKFKSSANGNRIQKEILYIIFFFILFLKVYELDIVFIYVHQNVIITHLFWKFSHLKYSFLPDMSSREVEERTGVLWTNDLILSYASFTEDMSAAYFVVSPSISMLVN